MVAAVIPGNRRKVAETRLVVADGVKDEVKIYLHAGSFLI
jgi:hypothetical protein